MRIGRVSRVRINRLPTNSVIRLLLVQGRAVILGYVSRLVNTSGQPDRPCKNMGYIGVYTHV